MSLRDAARPYLTHAAVALVALAVGGVLGYYKAPAKVTTRDVVRTETVEVEKVVERVVEKVVYRKSKDSTVRVVERIVETPDGTKTTERTKERDTHATEGTEAERTSATETNSVTRVNTERVAERVTDRRADWRASALVGVDVRKALAGSTFTSPFSDSNSPLVLGAQLERRVVGPAFVGLWGTSNGVVGASLSLEF